MTTAIHQAPNHHFEQSPNHFEDHDSHLADQTRDLSLQDQQQDYHQHDPYQQQDFHQDHEKPVVNGIGERDYAEGNHVAGNEKMALGSALAADPSSLREYQQHQEQQEHQNGEDDVSTYSRPTLPREPSRSYSKPIPIVTTYEPDLNDNASIDKRRSVAGSVKAPSVRRAASKAESYRETGYERPPTRTESYRGEDRAPTRTHSVRNIERPPTRAESVRDIERPATRTENRQERPASRQENARPSSRASVRSPSIKAHGRTFSDSQQGAAIGDVVSPERQRQLQNGVSLHDQGVGNRSTTFDDSNHPPRSMSPRPASAFGHRPQPNLMSVTEDGRESRYEGRDRNSGLLNRSGTVMSRANTLGRNGTMSRAANGGTVGSRRGAFGRGAGASIGTQPEEVLGRDDIHTRAELSERILDDATLRKLSTMEKKDAARLAKVIKNEGKSEAAAVKASIKELERLSRLQKEAAVAERKSQQRLSKWTSKEHKARLRFLKEKERYERVEGDLRNAENDYEERRDHAAGLTSQVAEKTQELDDLRGQKAADDREREVKLLALKNPAHS